MEFLKISEEEYLASLSYSERMRYYELDFYHELAREIKPLGYRCFLHDDKRSFAWLYIITPGNSLLYIDHDTYSCGGYNICYQYVPSRDFGTGCRCNEDGLHSITAETLEKAERYGKAFSARTWHNEYLMDSQGKYHKVRVTGVKKPAHYTDGAEALKKTHHYNELVEL